MFHKFLLTTAAVVALSATALAADLPTTKGPPTYVPPPPVFTWTGLYIGGQLGYEWGYAGTAGYPAYNPSGVVGGGHLGYNYQTGLFVLGLEGDFDGSGYSGHTTSGTLTYGTQSSIDASIRGRAGITFDRALFFVTGGAAIADFTNAYAGTGVYNSRTASPIGWTVGGGVEYALDNNWSLRADYRFTDYAGYRLYSTVVGGNMYQHEIESKAEAGFSYKFDLMGPIVAKY